MRDCHLAAVGEVKPDPLVSKPTNFYRLAVWPFDFFTEDIFAHAGCCHFTPKYGKGAYWSAIGSRNDFDYGVDYGGGKKWGWLLSSPVPLKR